MPSLRFSTFVALSLAVLSSLLVTAPATADEAESLERAIQLFADGEYLAAQELLSTIDRDKLTDDQRALRGDYLERVQVAITMSEKALRDLEDAETATAAREYDRAEQLLQGALNNEYAPESVRRAASRMLEDVRERAELVGRAAPQTATTTAQKEAEPGNDIQPEPPPAPAEESADTPADAVEQATALTKEGDNLLAAGRHEQAIDKYQAALDLVPGFPEAVAGIQRVRQHRENISGERALSLTERIRRNDAINWQRTVAQYREAERNIREMVLKERFDEANQALIRARQIVEAGKQFADPIIKYENLRSELTALEGYVRSEERTYNERQIAETRREIEQQRSARLRQVEENRARQVELLMQQALQHRKDGDLESAVNVLRQVTIIDPKHAPARWLMDILEDQRAYRESRKTRESFYKQSRGVLEDVEKSKIPWHEELLYPDNWLEILARPERRRPGETRPDQLLFGALDRQIPVDFNNDPFEQVVEHLADSQRINIIVNWHDLHRAGVERDAKIDLSLPREITLKKALTEILDQAGGGTVDLGYDVADGAVTVATRAFLDRKTYPAVYDVTDLLMEIPQFSDAPMIDLRQAYNAPTSRVSQRADLPWRVGDDDDDEPEDNDRRRARVRKLIDLIEDTVAPDSWRDRGGSVGMIKEINGQLVITQNSSAHKQIGGLLDSLREERAIQIAVEALFITVSSNYLEELGMDLDIVFNAGNAGYDFLNSGQGPVVDPVLGSRLLLPRTFSRLGFTQASPTQGVAMTPGPTPIQPFNSPSLVPQRTGGGGSEGTPVPFTSSILDFTDPSGISSDVPGSFAGQSVGPALGVFGSFLDNIQVDFLIRATQADSRSSVLTAPRLVVFNGASAWVAVTIQQGFVSQLNPVVAQGAVAQQPQTQVVDAGATLFVRATVTADKRYVMMLLAPGVTRLLALQTFQFSGGTGAFPAFLQIPTLSAQRVQTVVTVPDGGTLLIGGQKIANETEVEAGVPILSKIPVLKRLYSSRTMVKDEQVLLILIKPKILIQTEQEQFAFPSFSPPSS